MLDFGRSLGHLVSLANKSNAVSPKERVNPTQGGNAGGTDLPNNAASLPVISGVLDAILETGRQRHGLLKELRSALQSGSDQEALRLARQLCGLQ